MTTLTQVDALLGGDVRVEPERIGDLLAEHLQRLLGVHLHPAAEVVVLVQDPEQQVAVVDRRDVVVAALLEHRAGRAARAVRARA